MHHCLVIVCGYLQVACFFCAGPCTVHFVYKLYHHLQASLKSTLKYLGSSSVLVLIGSHSRCNSFVVNQFLFFHTKWRKFVIHPRSNESKVVDFFDFFIFFISKIYSHGMQQWRPKTGMVTPYCLCWKLLHTRWKYSDISNLFAKLQHAKVPGS